MLKKLFKIVPARVWTSGSVADVTGLTQGVQIWQKQDIWFRMRGFLEHVWLIWAWDRIYYTQIETIIAKNCGVVAPRLTLTRPQLVRRLVCRQGAFVRSGKLRPCALAGKDHDFPCLRAGIVFFATASSIYPWWEAYMTGFIGGCSVSTRRSRLPIFVRFGWKIQYPCLFVYCMVESLCWPFRQLRGRRQVPQDVLTMPNKAPSQHSTQITWHNFVWKRQF